MWYIKECILFIVQHCLFTCFHTIHYLVTTMSGTFYLSPSMFLLIPKLRWFRRTESNLHPDPGVLCMLDRHRNRLGPVPSPWPERKHCTEWHYVRCYGLRQHHRVGYAVQLQIWWCFYTVGLTLKSLNPTLTILVDSKLHWARLQQSFT